MRTVVALLLGFAALVPAVAQEATRSNPGLTRALSGELPGIVLPDSTQTSDTIIIRCGSTITGHNQPLYVVDGSVIEDSSYLQTALDPSDIATVSVLKGNEARHYGVRARNGVVAITTKAAARAAADAEATPSSGPYPNPVALGALVTVPASAGGPVRAEVFDTLGRRVLTAEPTDSETGFRIPTAGLSAGVYLIQVIGDDGPSTYPITVR